MKRAVAAGAAAVLLAAALCAPTSATAQPTRPPPGPAGVVHVAYHAARLRDGVLAWVERSRTFAAEFTGATPSLPARQRTPGWRITLDFRPAAALLSLVARPDSAELAALYRYAFPTGLMHFADVRGHLGDYRRLVETLSFRAGRMESTIAARLAPYVPQGTQVERTVRFLFADGADGWGIGDVYAIDLEYFKDDVDRLLDTLLHETFHAAQDAVEPGRRAVPRSAADSIFLTALRAIFREGTATHVAPPRPIGEEEYRSQVAEGVRLLTAIHDAAYADTPDLDRARTLHARGVRGAGPFYWLGAEMAIRIEERLGTEALAGTLRSDGAGFVVTYRNLGGELLPRTVVEAARVLLAGPPG